MLLTTTKDQGFICSRADVDACREGDVRYGPVLGQFPSGHYCTSGRHFALVYLPRKNKKLSKLGQKISVLVLARGYVQQCATSEIWPSTGQSDHCHKFGAGSRY